MALSHILMKEPRRQQRPLLLLPKVIISKDFFAHRRSGGREANFKTIDRCKKHFMRSFVPGKKCNCPKNNCASRDHRKKVNLSFWKLNSLLKWWRSFWLVSVLIILAAAAVAAKITSNDNTQSIRPLSSIGVFQSLGK